MGPSILTVVVPLPCEVVIWGSDSRGGARSECGKIFVEISIDPAAQSAFNLFANGK